MYVFVRVWVGIPMTTLVTTGTLVTVVTQTTVTSLAPLAEVKFWWSAELLCYVYISSIIFSLFRFYLSLSFMGK
jgi:hypothetical protein